MPGGVTWPSVSPRLTEFAPSTIRALSPDAVTSPSSVTVPAASATIEPLADNRAPSSILRLPVAPVVEERWIVIAWLDTATRAASPLMPEPASSAITSVSVLPLKSLDEDSVVPPETDCTSTVSASSNSSLTSTLTPSSTVIVSASASMIWPLALTSRRPPIRMLSAPSCSSCEAATVIPVARLSSVTMLSAEAEMFTSEPRPSTTSLLTS